jgi:hypothetical protein
MKENAFFRRSTKEKRLRQKLAAVGVAASMLIPACASDEKPAFDDDFVCDVARHRAGDPQLKDEGRLQDIITNAYRLNPREGYQLFYYFDLATSNIGQPIPQELENEIVEVEVQNDTVGLEFHTNHNQLYRDATAPSPDSITILTKDGAKPVENTPIVLYSRKMIIQDENKDRFYPLNNRRQKIIDPNHSTDSELTRNHGVEVVRFCNIPGKGEVAVNAGYLDLRVFPIVYIQPK